MIHEFEVVEYMPKRLRECALVAHITSQIDAFIDYVY
jgi:hypothetical protein